MASRDAENAGYGSVQGTYFQADAELERTGFEIKL